VQQDFSCLLHCCTAALAAVGGVLMADTSMVELADLIEQRSGIRLLKPYGTGVKRTRKGPCPFCKQGTDRFAVFVNAGVQHYHCGINSYGCGAHGDAITFLREYAGLNYFEACEELDIDPGSEYVHRDFSALDSNIEKPPSQTWQLRAELIIDLAQRTLLKSRKGAHALEYLHSRGFIDETIEKARLGYIPEWMMQSFESWGLSAEDYPGKQGVWLYEGILIPCYEGETIWKLTVRRLTGLKEDDPKYLDILGSGEGLFNVDAIETNKPVVICEGPLDALTGIQQCGDMAAFVATGSVKRGRILRWESRFWLASHVLIAYDDDRAGDEGAKYWLQTLPHAVQWLPWSHDLNDLLVESKDLHAWLQLGIASSELKQETEDDISDTVVPQPPEQERRKPWPARYDSKLPCYRCGGNELLYEPEMSTWMCLCYFDMKYALDRHHFKPRKSAVPGTSKCCRCEKPAVVYGNDVKPYCVDCSPVKQAS